ncbi:hypothetical protein ACNFBT_11720 [Pseudomonas sp. NY15181]|uniref:hypothetical protein n=1 Tax=Pseudomonas sp. NY15181 TaxID=3400349 RepID=UPI003A8C6BA6
MIEIHYIPLPMEEESPFSLLQRAAKMNGFYNSRLFLEAKGLITRPSINPAYEDSDFAKLLSRNAEKYDERIRASFYHSSISNERGTQIIINGISINTKLIRLSGAAVCSECVKDGWDRVISDFAPANSCPYHNRKYLFRCPSCGRKFTHLNRKHGGCKCLYQFTSPRCSAIEDSLGLKLLELLRSRSQEKIDTFTKVLTHFRWQQKSRKNSERQIIVAIALSVCRSEILNVVELIRKLYRIHNTVRIDTDFIITMMKPCISQEMLQTLQKYFSSNEITKGRMRLLPCGLSARQLQTYLGINQSHWELIRDHPKFPCPRRRYYYTPKEIRSILSVHKEISSQREMELENLRKQNSLTLKEAADRLLLTDAALREITQTDFLKEETKHYGISRRISVKSIEAFEKEFITITQLEQNLKRPRSEIRRSIKVLNIYRIPLPHGDKHTIAVRKADINDISTHLLSRKNQGNAHGKYSTLLPKAESNLGKSFYTSIEASKHLGVDHTTICQLVRSYILRAHYQGSHGRYLIEASDVESFHSKYIFAKEVSALLKTAKNQTSDILIQHEISAITGRRIDGEPVGVFLRSDITPELIKKISRDDCPFGISFKRGELITTIDAASMLGISRHTAITIKKLIITPFRPEHFKNHSRLCPADVKKMKKYLDSYIPTAAILAKTWMSRRDLNEFLIKPSLVQEIIINGEPHTTIDQAKIIIDFEQRYCTCRGAEIILNAPKGHIKWAVRTGRMKAVRTPKGITSPQILLDRRAIEKMTYPPRWGKKAKQ